MENRGYSIYEVGILGGNDKVKTNLFVLFVLTNKYNNIDYEKYKEQYDNVTLLVINIKECHGIMLKI